MESEATTEDGIFFHLHISDSTPKKVEELELADGTKAKVIWKDVLVEGEYPMSPGPNGAIATPMRVVETGPSDMSTKTISMADLISAHEDGAFKYVTIPTSHKDGLMDNTGYVPRPNGVRVIDRDGKKVMQSALGFTEPDVKGKVERGTIPDVSAGIFFNWVNKHTKKRYPCAMKHVALTGTPFMGNLDSFAPVFASDDEISSDVKVEHYALADATDATDTNPVVVWNENHSHRAIRTKVEQALSPLSTNGAVEVGSSTPSYYVQDIDVKDNALVEEYYKGKSTKFVVPFTRSDTGEIDISPSVRWTEVREAMIAASDKDFDTVSLEAVKKKATAALVDQVNANGAEFSVDTVSIDGRAKIVGKSGSSYIANFAMLSDDTVVFSHPSEWTALERKEIPKPKPVAKKVTQPSPKPKLSIALSDSPEEKLEAARTRRRQLLGAV